jgi:hypothetical protein
MTYTFSLAPATKGTHLRYHHAGLGSIYLAKTMVAGQPPATISITAEGLAEPKAAKELDAAALQAEADKAAERAARAAERAQKLAELVSRLKADQPPADQPPADQPAAKRRGKAKAA